MWALKSVHLLHKLAYNATKHHEWKELKGLCRRKQRSEQRCEGNTFMRCFRNASSNSWPTPAHAHALLHGTIAKKRLLLVPRKLTVAAILQKRQGMPSSRKGQGGGAKHCQLHVPLWSIEAETIDNLARTNCTFPTQSHVRESAMATLQQNEALSSGAASPYNRQQSGQKPPATGAPEQPSKPTIPPTEEKGVTKHLE